MTSPAEDDGPVPGLGSDDDPGTEPARRRRGPRVLTVIGLVLLLAGVGMLGWVGYQYFGTDVVSKQSFTSERGTLRDTWNSPAPSGSSHDDAGQVEHAVPGSAIALLRVPSWGSGYEVPIVKGTDVGALAKGVGMYDSSVAPGQVGNFAIAGHRITHGEPFSRLLELKKGDTVIVETRTAIYTYVLDNSPADLTVEDTANWVLDPVPGHPDEKPTRPLLTMTTCQDLFHSPDRSVAFGHLVSTEQKH